MIFEVADLLFSKEDSNLSFSACRKKGIFKGGDPQGGPFKLPPSAKRLIA